MKTLFCALALMGFSAMAVAAKDPRVLSLVELKERAARPVIIVAPTYPEAAVREGREATVDVTGTVNADGILEGATMSGAAEEFLGAVRDVIPYWRFTPLYGDECQPKPAAGAIRVWFELKRGKPAISVSRGQGSVVDEPAREATAVLKVVKRVEPEYPHRAIRAGRQGDVEALALVDENGDVKSVTIIPSTTPPLFGDTVAEALKQWKFAPPPGGKPVCAYYEVDFRLH